ncbi:uncharacterized protein [Temnothorax nylanderi]|uniref:uncharacterized protein n=1 Tax=Temnothorax nylanderi TaxID=102681 RepID=UPI003A8A13F8
MSHQDTGTTMSEGIGNLRKARGYTKSKLTRLRKEALQAANEDDVGFDKEQAETRLEKLEEIYNGFENIQKQLLENLGGLTADDIAEEELFEGKYFEVKAILKRFIKQTSTEGAASQNTDAITQILQQQTELMQRMGRGAQDNASAMTPTPVENETLTAILSRQTEILNRVANAATPVNIDTRVKLPTITLPRFDGKIEEWKCFADSFRSIIHDKPHLSSIEKFQYLVSSISGDAAKIIESIELTDQNYIAAWELLQQRYDDPRSLKKKHIQCLFSMPTITKESARALRELIDYTSRHMRMLKVLGSPTDTWDELIMHMMETRFDVRTLRAWEEEIESNEGVKLIDMLEFLRKRCQTLERIESRSVDKSEKQKENEQRGKGSSATFSKPHSLNKGAANQKTASLTASLNSELPVSDRIKEVRRLKLCINCLKDDHYVKTCKRGPCRKCAEKHNTLCHQPQGNKVKTNSEGTETQGESNSNQSISNVAVHHASSNVKRRRVLMATAIVETIQRNGSKALIRVLLDSASEANFITQAACNKLALKRQEVAEIVTGLNEIENKVHYICDVHIKSRCSNFQINAQCLIVPKITKNLPSTTIPRDKLEIPSNIELADFEFNKIGPIDMLIGAEFFFDLLETGKIELKDQLILQNTKFGWIVAGSMPSNEGLNLEQNAVSSLICSLKSCEVLNENLEKFWKLEHYDNDNTRVLSIDDKKCEQYFEQTTTRAEDGRFIVRLPFRDVNMPIGNNREIALKRLNQLERMLKGNEVMRERYTKFMREYVDLGHMSIVDDSLDNLENVVYLPHHGVLKESSSSTKLRVVFNASAKNNRGVSLNDALFVGPVMQDNLIDIIIRFRFYIIALTADLQKMYRQVLVHEDDRDFQRILWRFSCEEIIKAYRLNTVTYGEACAAFLAIKSLIQLAKEGIKRYPLASLTLLENTYVDDVISGANTIEEARILQKQLTLLLQEGGFTAHKWCSNSEDVLIEIPIELRESSLNLNIDANDVIRTLGLEWNTALDEFQFTTPIIERASTKREILSAISKLFDPLGLIGPVLTVAKILMQELWKTKVDWDDPLPEVFKNEWKSFQENLKEVNMLRIPRIVISTQKASRFVIQGFCDASEKAYGACIYIQSINETTGEITIKLLCSKARVTPLKRQTISRLELCSASLLAKLIASVKRAIRIKIDEICARTDSKVVLYWLRGNIARWKPFVYNRVNEIVEILPATNWKHVKGSENPADLISRGATPAQLKDNHLWWNGPKWLSDIHQLEKNEEHNRELTEEELYDAENESRKESQVCHLHTHQSSASDDVIHKLVRDCSTLTKIERSLAYCFRFIFNCRKKRKDRILTRLTLGELNLAKREIIKYSQRMYFQEDLKSLQDKRELHRSSQLQQLQVFQDEEGLIRVGGRLQEAPWNFQRKHPILLSAQCKITRLLIERVHRTLLHASQQLLLATIRQQYWPLNARNLIRQVCRSCVWCVRNNPKGLTQAMGSLPGDRIRPTRAFSITGVDFAGPIITLVNKGRGRKTCKSYVVLFICFATKAIHLEATSELSTAAFLAALRRFIGRRGLPSKICSDNATNFVGAKRELEELYTFIQTSIKGSVGDALQEKGIEWCFIPPYSPHLGGLWEAGVKSCKYHLKRVMGNTLFTFEELTTVLVQIEACLNSRPLSPLSSDPSDLQPLTPGHFLVGGPLNSLPEDDLTDVNINRLHRWELIQRSVQDFWKRWAAEYVANLQSRVKWRTRQENLKINDLVLLKEENLPPLRWKIGRVVEVHPGKDNLVRVASVRTATGISKRAIAKLCKLPISDTVYKEDQ